MIKSFKHKGLKAFFKTGSTAKINVDHSKKLRLILSDLHAATVIEDMNAPAYGLHQLKGDRTEWSVKVSGNWRITFEFIDGDAYILNYEDYH